MKDVEFDYIGVEYVPVTAHGRPLSAIREAINNLENDQALRVVHSGKGKDMRTNLARIAVEVYGKGVCHTTIDDTYVYLWKGPKKS